MKVHNTKSTIEEKILFPNYVSCSGITKPNQIAPPISSMIYLSIDIRDNKHYS